MASERQKKTWLSFLAANASCLETKYNMKTVVQFVKTIIEGMD